MVTHDDKWFSTNWYGLALQQLVYTATAKITKVKWTRQAWNGTVYVGSYVTTLQFLKVFRRPLVLKLWIALRHDS